MELKDLLGGELLAWLADGEPDTVENNAGDYAIYGERAAAASANAGATTGSTPQPGSTLPACTPTATGSSSHSLPTATSRSCVRFAPPKTDAEIEVEREKGIPKKTLEDTKYCLKIWEEWRKHRVQTTGDT